MELRHQITRSGVQVDVDAPKGQDLAQIMEDMRANYEKIGAKNAEDLKRWHDNQVGSHRWKMHTDWRSIFYLVMSFPTLCQIAEVQAQVSQNTEALQGAQMEIGDLTRQLQTLEIELASQQSLVSKHFQLINAANARLNQMWDC